VTPPVAKELQVAAANLMTYAKLNYWMITSVEYYRQRKQIINLVLSLPGVNILLTKGSTNSGINLLFKKEYYGVTTTPHQRVAIGFN